MVIARPIRARKSLPKVEVPVYVDRIPKFTTPLHRFEMVIEWHRSLDRNPRVQRIGFKASGNFLDAMAEAQRLTLMLNRSYGKTQKEIDKADFCRLIAVYEEKAFKDYAAEPLYNKEAQRQAVQKHVEGIREYDKTVSTKVPRNSIRTIRVQ
jgi:predicted transport protein